MKRMWSLKQIKEFIKGTTKDISTLVDKDGHERFIEGDIVIKEIEGVSKVYGKWSLSGTHLMLVLCCAIADTTVLTNGTTLADIDLPEWIEEKIVPVFANNVDNKTIALRDNNWGSQNTAMLLQKDVNGLHLVNGASITLTADRTFRCQFDLLIDNE